ncbi:MAG: glucose-1-phosphate adenylyltransferase [Christensenellales bacterium]|jgi:glucose-1-phosphate adenylyltransferase
MAVKKRCIAMLLAGGQGSRLGILTLRTAKPAVPFGGKYRLIDFPLSNCSNSGIDTVGVLTQYLPLELNTYIGSGRAWDLDKSNGGVFILPPYQNQKKSQWYKGTANAIYQNIAFIEQYNPDNVLILGGDHIYKMNYAKMLSQHTSTNADVTTAALLVPWEEASRFGVINTDDTGAITEFEEKPKNPRSNKASMGIYIFKWDVLKQYLEEDELKADSQNDFGGDILPQMLADGKRMFTYEFSDYWKDVGTIDALWEANMDLLETLPLFDLYDGEWRIYSRNPGFPPHYVGKNASLEKSIITEGSEIYGLVNQSVIFAGVIAREGSKIYDSVIMPNTVIGENCLLRKVIVSEGSVIGKNCNIGGDDRVTVIGKNVVVPDGTKISGGMQISQDYFNKV